MIVRDASVTCESPMIRVRSLESFEQRPADSTPGQPRMPARGQLNRAELSRPCVLTTVIQNPDCDS